MKKFLPEILAILLIIGGFLGMLHQKLTTRDGWLDRSDLFSHETIVACFVVAAAALVIGKYLGREKNVRL